MERKIDETFEYEGKKLKVMADRVDTCEACFFDGHCTRGNKALAGKCGSNDRDDGKNVIFVEVQEQPQTEQPKLNLCEILKHCPKGEKFWSPMFGYVVYHGIIKGEVGVTIASGVPMTINADGTLTINFVTSPEVMLYPSREQRDWTKVKYEPKKERFNPNTLKAFDKVLARLDSKGIWCCELFSFIEDNTNLIKCCGAYYQYCIPYNDNTKHLVGTTDEAPVFYRYWED